MTLEESERIKHCFQELPDRLETDDAPCVSRILVMLNLVAPVSSQVIFLRFSKLAAFKCLFHLFFVRYVLRSSVNLFEDEPDGKKDCHKIRSSFISRMIGLDMVGTVREG